MFHKSSSVENWQNVRMQVLEFKICIQAEIAKNMVNARVDFAKEMYVKGNKPTRLALLIVIVQMVYFAIV